MKLRNKLKTHRSFLLHGLLPFLLFSISPALTAEEDTSEQARQLINEMSKAGRELNYDGTFVYRRGNRMDTMRLIHKYDDEGEHERMYALTGIAREVIRDDKSVTCIFPDNQKVMVEKSRPRKFLTTKLPEPIEKIADYYSFSITGKDRVAGRSTWMINITPNDDFRYGYQLWVDEDSKLLMKSEIKDGSGWPVEQILFTQLDIVKDIPAQLLKPAISGKDYTWYDRATTELPVQSSNSVWTVMKMPAGFSMTDFEKQQASVANQMPVEHMIYSDGLAMVSVFIEKVNSKPEQMRGASRMGGVNAFATIANGYQITAVGEVPQKTVQLMANSVIEGQ